MRDNPLDMVRSLVVNPMALSYFVVGFTKDGGMYLKTAIVTIVTES